MFFPHAKVHLQFNLRINVQSFNSGFLSMRDNREFSYHCLQFAELKMFQKIITCSGLTLPTFLPFYFPWCLLSAPKISSAIPQFLNLLPSPEDHPHHGAEEHSPSQTCSTVICQPHRLRKKWQKMHTEVIVSWSKILSVFSGKGSKLYKTRQFKAQIVIYMQKKWEFTKKICALSSTYWKT